MCSVDVSRKLMEAELSPLRRLQWHGVGSKPQVDVGDQLVATHASGADLVIEVDGNLCISGTSGLQQMINQRLKPDVTVCWEREGEVGRVLVQIRFSLDPVMIDFDNPNDLVVSPVVRCIVIEEEEM